MQCNYLYVSICTSIHFILTFMHNVVNMLVNHRGLYDTFTSFNYCRGLPSMAYVITNEIATWPSILQIIISYIITPTVIVPFIGLQLYVTIYFG